MSLTVDVSSTCDGCGLPIYDGDDIYGEECAEPTKRTGRHRVQDGHSTLDEVLRRAADDLSALLFDLRATGVDRRLCDRLDAIQRAVEDEAPAPVADLRKVAA